MTNEHNYLDQMLKAQALLQTVATLTFKQQSKQLIFNHEYIKLFSYQSNLISKFPPLLIVFSTINTPDILDLHPDYSLIKALLESGQDVYLIEWVEPLIGNKFTSIEDYVCHAIDAAVNFIIEKHQLAKLNILSICQGGLFSLCYAALYNKIEKLILLTTPIDFHADEHVITNIAKQIDIDAIDHNVPGVWLSNFFISLRPFELIGKKYLTLLDSLDKKDYIEQFLLVEKWLKNSPDQSMMAFKQLIKDFYQHNKLIKNEIYLNNQPVQLMNIEADILNIIASEDDIVSPLASAALKQYVPVKQYTEQYLASGHIGIYLNKIVGKELALVITKWLSGNTD